MEEEEDKAQGTTAGTKGQIYGLHEAFDHTFNRTPNNHAVLLGLVSISRERANETMIVHYTAQEQNPLPCKVLCSHFRFTCTY